jgi:hypothetical protein
LKHCRRFPLYWVNAVRQHTPFDAMGILAASVLI